MNFAKNTVCALLIFLVLDFIWFSFIAKSIYFKHLGTVLRITNGSLDLKLWAAALVYIALVAGIVVFVIPKANASVWLALGWGALFGLLAYGIYDFTNLAVLKNWSLAASLLDVVWGAFVCGVTSALTVWICR